MVQPSLGTWHTCAQIADYQRKMEDMQVDFTQVRKWLGAGGCCCCCCCCCCYRMEQAWQVRPHVTCSTRGKGRCQL